MIIMKDENNNYVGILIFFAMITVLVIVGSTFVYIDKKNKLNEKKYEDKTVIVNDKKKQDKDKDFIYYNNIDSINDDSIEYKTPVINLNSDDATLVNEKLAELINEQVNNLIKIETEEDISICPNKNLGDIKSGMIYDYTIYNFEEYITLSIEEKSYDCSNGYGKTNSLSSYTFNVLTGKLIKSDELLSIYNITATEMINKMENNLSDNENETIDVDETINELKENSTYTIFIDESGNLVVKCIVKTNLVDYNDIINLSE